MSIDRDKLKEIIYDEFGQVFNEGTITAIVKLLDYNYSLIQDIPSIEKDHFFSSTDERDAYFPTRLDELILGTPIVVSIGTVEEPVVNIQIWSGDTNPSVYDNTLWAASGNLSLTLGEAQTITTLNSITDKTIPVKDGDSNFKDSSLTEEDERVECNKPFYAEKLETLSSSVVVGSNTISSNTEGIEIQNGITEQRSIVIQSRYCDTCSDLPYYPKLEDLQEYIISDLEDITIIEEEGSFIYTVSEDRHSNVIIIKPAAIGTVNIIVSDNTTGQELYRVSNYEIVSSDVGNEVEITADAGGQAIVRENSIIKIEISGVNLKGHQYVSDVDFTDQLVPYFKIKGQTYSEKVLATQEYAVFGTEAEDWESLDESSSGYTWTDKLDITTVIKPIGRYRIGFNCEITETGASEEVRFLIDGCVIHNHTTGNDELEPNLEEDNWTPISEFAYLNLTTKRTIDLNIQHKDSGSGKMSNARIEIWRVS